MQGYKTAILAGLMVFSGLADLLPGVEAMVPSSAYRWLLFASGVAVLIVRHFTVGRAAWRRPCPCDGPQAGAPAPYEDDDISYGGTA